MKTFLLTWNPKQTKWTELEKSSNNLMSGKRVIESWSSGLNRSILAGSRVFLIRLGKEPKGIMASGWTVSKVYPGNHWKHELALQGKKANYVKIQWDIILNPQSDQLLARKELNKGVLREMYWNSRASGVRIPDNVALELEKNWAQFIKYSSVDNQYVTEEDLINQEVYLEGKTKKITINVYERNPDAREACLKHYGYNCSVCGFNFYRVYGKIGKSFIHVHHLKQLADIKKSYKLDPIRDLRPVCPNCHAMIHKKKPAYSVNEIKSTIKRVES